MLKKVINYAKGSVRVSIYGGFVERFLNICSQADISFWGVKRLAPDHIEASMPIEDYKQVRYAARRTGCRTKILKKKGVPFQVHRYLHRFGLWGGGLACAVGIYLLSTCIWTISVSADGGITDWEVRQIAESYGIKAGVRRSKIDELQIKNSALIDHEQLSFFSINMLGSHCELVVRTREPKPEFVPDDQPCNIIADRDGVVEEILATDGTKIKLKGQSVVAGDTLISGILTGVNGDETRVHATGQVTLRTWRKVEIMAPKGFYGKDYTGKQKVRYTLALGDKGIKLYFVEKNPFVCYDKRYEISHINLYGDIRLPIGIVKETYLEYNRAPLLRTPGSGSLEDEAKTLFAQKYPDAQVVLDSFETEDMGNFIKLTYQAECLEKTGVKTPMEG